MSNETNLPTLSIVIVTLNAETIIGECLRRITQQTYPKELVEILVIDGGSTDQTIEIAKGYDVRVIDGGFPDIAEARRAVGLLAARNEILFYLDADNLLPHRNWLMEMVKPFMEDPSIIATQTLRYAYNKTAPLIDRYYALFGAGDPVAYYLGKRDRLSWFEHEWKLPGQVVENRENYYKVKISLADFPPLGCNGFAIRKEIILKANCEPEQFSHADAPYELAAMGYDTYGIVKNDILHLTGKTLWNTLRKRTRYMITYNFQKGNIRKYKTYNPTKIQDNIKLLLFVFYTITLVKPSYDALKGFVKSKIYDMAWFIHPFMCMGFLIAYSYGVIAHMGAILFKRRA